MQHLEAAIRTRAYALWIESGHVHGLDEQHWHQAEREIAEAEAQPVVIEQVTAAAVEAVPAKPVRKKAASPPVVAAAPAFVRKVRAPRQASSSAALN